MLLLPLRGAAIAADKEQVGGREVADLRFAQSLIDGGRLRTHALNVPEGVRWDSLAVLPSEGDARYSLGHIHPLP
jgi:hypothetical protein